MTKNRVYSHEDRTSEKCKTSSFLFLRSHFSFLMIVCILLKKVKVSWEAPPTKNSQLTETYQSTCIISQRYVHTLKGTEKKF